MTDLSKSLISIDAPIADVQKALFELDKYPEWSTQIKSAEVLAHDDQGRGVAGLHGAGPRGAHAAAFRSAVGRNNGRGHETTV